MTHDHCWGLLKQFAALSNCQIVAAADSNEPLRKKIAELYGVEKLYEDVEQMIDSEDLDAVLVTGDNAASVSVLEKAAPLGIHALVEKPMAATLEQADRMLKAATDGGTKLMINWPMAWKPEVHKAFQMCHDGEIGQVFYVRVRMAHEGPKEIGCSEYFWGWLYDAEKNGAGALMDYCCYGAAFCRWLLGRPSAVQGVRGHLAKPYPVPDDNAVITMLYDKHIASTEASWTQHPGFHEVEILGTEGTLRTWHGKLLLWKEGQEPTEVQAEPLPEGMRNGPEHFLHCLDTGAEPQGMCHPQVARDAQEILEAGLRSADTGQRITLPL